jgi:hypothetical protein
LRAVAVAGVPKQRKAAVVVGQEDFAQPLLQLVVVVV